MKNTKELGTEPIGKLLAKYSIPAIIAMLVNAIYNIVDRIFIGQFVGEEALAGLTIAFPVMMMIFAFASLIGSGGAALMSIKLGEKDVSGTGKVFANMIGLGFIVSLVCAVALYINLEGVLNLFGASPDTLGYAVDYLQIILVGFIFQMTSYLLSSAVRTEGMPMLSMGAMMVSAVSNMILDYLFIGVLDMGVKGAAIATITGQFLGLCLLLSFYVRGKSGLHITLKDFVPRLKLWGQIVTIGFATFISTIGASIASAVLNTYLGKLGGTAAITSMGAINSLFTLCFMPLMGIQQGLQPIIGYNYGAKQTDRTYKSLGLGLLVGVVFSSVVFVILQVFPQVFISMFLDSTSNTMDIAVTGLKYYILMLPLLSINVFGIAFYQSTAKGKTAFILGLLRRLLFLIPTVIIFSNSFGLIGTWIAVPVSDGLAILVTGIALIITYRKEMNNKNSDVSDEKNSKDALVTA